MPDWKSEATRLKDELEQLQQKTAQIEAMSRIGSYSINLDTNQVEWSKGVYNIFEFDDSNPPPSPSDYYRLLHPDDANLVKERFELCVLNSVSFDLSYRIISASGNIKNVHSKAEIVLNNRNERLLYGFFRDITQQCQYEAEIIDLNHRMTMAFEAGGMAWWEMLLPSGEVKFGENKTKMLGLNKNEFKHYTDFMDYVHPNDYEDTMQAMRDHISGTKPQYESDYRIRNTYGDYIWFRDFGKIVEDTGEIKKVLGIVVNIESLKKLEHELRESENQKRLILESTSELITYYDLDLNIVWANKAAIQTIGKKPGEVTGKSCRSVWQDSDKHCLKCPVLLTKQTQQPTEAECCYSLDKYWYLRCYPVFDANNKFVAIAEFRMDITQRRRSEEALKLSEQRYKRLVEDSPMAILLLKDGVIEFANTAFATICGLKHADDSNGRSILDYTHTSDKPLILAYLDKSRYNTLHYSQFFSAKFYGENHSVKYLDISFSEIASKDGKIVQLIMHDVSEKVGIKNRSKNILTDALYMSRKLSRFADIKMQLEQILSRKQLKTNDFVPIVKILNEERNIEQLWNVFKSNFELVYEDFFAKLIQQAPTLSQLELKHCAFIKLNFETKEIAQMFNVKPTSIQMGRVRIKKKLGLSPEQDLSFFLLTL